MYDENKMPLTPDPAAPAPEQEPDEVVSWYVRPDEGQEITDCYVQPGPMPAAAAPKAVRQEKRRSRKGLWTFLVILAVLVGVVLGVAIVSALRGGNTDGYGDDFDDGDHDASSIVDIFQSDVPTIPRADTDPDLRFYCEKAGEEKLTIQQVYQRVNPATVLVLTDLGEKASVGTGVILTADGYILTNYHVIENSNSVKVTMYDGTSYDATIVGYDESNDIAVLKIDASDLTPVVLGDSDTLNVGDSVVAIGNPLGELTFSLTTGVVSALDRPVTLSTGTTMNLIQTDCAINSGNSGGALFNLYGEVIGITNAKYSSSGSSSEASIDNIGFAIPIDQVRSIFESIITNGYIVKPYIGVTVSDVSSESQSYGLPQGAAVRSVTENGPAAEAGLQENDIITAVNGETITGSNDLVKLVKASAAGDTLELTVYRQGQTTTLTLTVGEQKTDALPAQTTDQNQQSQQGYYDGGQSGQSDNQFGGSWPFGFGFGG